MNIDPAQKKAAVASGGGDRSEARGSYLPPGTEANEILTAALSYAARGWPVLPLHNPHGGRCSCGKRTCRNIGKHPRTPKGRNDATTDPKEIRTWWTRWPRANVGIATGRKSGLVVLDVDPRNGGDESLAELQQINGPLPLTVEAITGGGGAHIVMAHPGGSVKGNNTGRLGAGLDVKADGGYIVAAPSLHASGRRYEWELSSHPDEVSPAEIPVWLGALLEGEDKGGTGWTSAGSAGTQPGVIHDGKRNSTLTSLAGTMRRRAMGEDAIYAALAAENADKCRPRLDDAEVRQIAASISRYKPAASAEIEGADEHPPVAEPTPWPAAPAEEAFHGLAGEIVRASEPHTEADPAALLVQFLVAFGSVVGRGPHFFADGSRHHANLFAVMVGQTAKGRKGTSWQQIVRPFESAAPEWKSGRVLSGLASGEGLIWAVRDPIKTRMPVKERGRPTGEYDEVESDPGVSDKRLLVQEGELAQCLKVVQREGNTLSPLIRLAWDTGQLRTLTKNSPAAATDAHISIIGHITQDELRRLLDATEAANGFANRFLWVCVRRSKVLPEGGQIHTVDFSDLVRRLTDAITFSSALVELRRDAQAKDLWKAVYPDLSEGKPGMLGAVTSRAEAQVMRLACVYALLDESIVIRPDHLSAALALWNYCEASARYVFGSSLGDRAADEILAALKASHGGMTRTEIRDLFGRNKGAEQVGQALGVLLTARLARRQAERSGGRPAERWFYTGGVTTKTT